MRIQLNARELLETINDNEQACMGLTPSEKTRAIALLTGCGMRKAREFVKSLATLKVR